MLSVSWTVLNRAQREGKVAVSEPYAHARHPQNAALILIVLGYLLQWPTLVTLAMLPILRIER